MPQSNPRRSDLPIDPLFLERWSPRAFTAELIPENVLLSFIEAARWAPSSSNVQPWRFIYARRDTPAWPGFLSLCNPFNQTWAGSAAALVFVVSESMRTTPGSDARTPSGTHSLDAGAAWGSFALQATRSGWATHGMAGIEYERAAAELRVPPEFKVEMAIAVGRQGDPSSLSEKLAAREVPSDRLPLASIAFEGTFRA